VRLLRHVVMASIRTLATHEAEAVRLNGCMWSLT